jgi:RNA recognition motif-containing protein
MDNRDAEEPNRGPLGPAHSHQGLKRERGGETQKLEENISRFGFCDSTMATTLFVGNLSWDTANEGPQEFLSSSGANCISAQVQSHSDSGRSKGWGLAEFSTPEEAKAAILALNNQELNGRVVNIREVQHSNYSRLKTTD